MALPSAPQPQPWPMRSNNQVWASDVNTQLSQAVAFLVQPPAFWAGQQTSGQQATNNAITNIILDTPQYDNYLGQNDATFVKYTVQPGCGGIWLLAGEVPYLATSGTSNFQASLNVNGVVSSGPTFRSGTGDGVIAPNVADLVAVTPGQWLALSADQTSGAAVSLFNGVARMPWLSARWVANSTGITSTPPSPRTWAIGDQTTVAMFNTEIYDAVSFLSYVPFCRVLQSTPQTIAPNTSTAMNSMNVTNGMDNYSAFASNTWTCQVSGTYLVGAQVAMSNTSNCGYVCQLITDIGGVNATYDIAAVEGQAQTTVGGTKTLRLSAGDTIRLGVDHDNAGGNINTLPSSTRLFTLWTSS